MYRPHGGSGLGTGGAAHVQLELSSDGEQQHPGWPSGVKYVHPAPVTHTKEQCPVQALVVVW